MLRHLHANATTTPRTRAYIQASAASVALLAAELGVSETTIRRWRGRSSADDLSHTRHNPGQATTPVEEAIISELRRLGRLSLDDITEVMDRCINPHLSRGSVTQAIDKTTARSRQNTLRSPAKLYDSGPSPRFNLTLRSVFIASQTVVVN